MVNGMVIGMVDKHRPVGRPPPKRPTRTPDENFSNSLASASETTQRSTFRRLPSCSPAGRPLDDNAVQDSFRDGTPAHRHIGTSAHHKRCSVRPASTTSDRSSTPSSTIRLTQASLQTASSPSKRATSPTPTRSSASATTSLHCSSGRSSAGTTRIQAPARRLLNLRGQSQGRRSRPCSAAAHSEH